jgi:tetratricopeptide (TPR) repeat protein
LLKVEDLLVSQVKSLSKSKYQELFVKTYITLGFVNDTLGNLNDSMKYYSEVLKLEPEISDKKYIAHVYNNLGEIYRFRGELKTALMNHKKALEL